MLTESINQSNQQIQESTSIDPSVEYELVDPSMDAQMVDPGTGNFSHYIKTVSVK